VRDAMIIHMLEKRSFASVRDGVRWLAVAASDSLLPAAAD